MCKIQKRKEKNSLIPTKQKETLYFMYFFSLYFYVSFPTVLNICIPNLYISLLSDFFSG